MKSLTGKVLVLKKKSDKIHSGIILDCRGGLWGQRDELDDLLKFFQSFGFPYIVVILPFES